MNTQDEASKCGYCGGNIAADAVWCHLCGHKVDDQGPQPVRSQALNDLPPPVNEIRGDAGPHPEEEMLVNLLTRPATGPPIFAINAEAPHHTRRPWWIDIFSFRKRPTKPWYIKARDVILLALFCVLFARMVFIYLSH